MGADEPPGGGTDPPPRADQADPAVVAGTNGAAPATIGLTDRSQPAGRVFAIVLRQLHDQALARIPGVLADDDPEELHDFRVAIRRTRSLLRAGTGVLLEPERRELRDELRWLAGVTSPVRDLDVLSLDLPQLAERLQPELRTGLAPLTEALEAERAGAEARLVEALGSERLAALRRTWVRCSRVYLVGGDTPPGALAPAGPVADRMILRAMGRMRRAGRRALRSDALVEWHDLRKALKQFRYVVAEVSPLYPSGTFRSVRSELPDLQDVLGRLQDHHVQAELIARVGTATGGTGALAAGVLANRLHRDVHRQHRRCARTWRAFEESPSLGRLERELRRDD